MRPAVRLARLGLQGSQQTSASLTQSASRLADSQTLGSEVTFTRSFAAGGGHPPLPPPDAFTQVLMKVMPPIAALPNMIFSTAGASAGFFAKTASGSAPAQMAVSILAQHILVGELVYKMEENNIPAWAYWLSAAGHTDSATFTKMAQAVKGQLPTMSPSQVVDLVVGFHKAHCYDKEVFDLVAANIKSNFTEYEAEGLLKIVGAFGEFGHYEEGLFDDIADSITYCNSMWASEAAPLGDVAAAFAAYAKFNHARGDLFNNLQRGLWNLHRKKKLNASSPAELKDAVLSISRAFSTFSYWPYNTQMVLGVAKKRPEIFTEAEIKEIDSYADRAEATWGKLTYYREGFSDFKNYQEHAQVIAPTPGLYAFDDTLVPASYSPSALRSDLKPKAA